jgi:hypothetical protein
MPKGRMGPPLRSFAADAYDCIMVRVLGATGYKVVARLRGINIERLRDPDPNWAAQFYELGLDAT